MDAVGEDAVDSDQRPAHSATIAAAAGEDPALFAELRAAFGDDVVDHYHHAAQWEISETDRVVTDFELQRLLERA